MDDEFVQMIERLTLQLQEFWTPILYLSVLIGLIFIIMGLYYAGKSGGRVGAAKSLSMSTLSLLVGFVLINIPAALDTMALSTLQQTSMQELSYSGSEGTGQIYIQLAVYIIQLVGLVGFIRGWVMIRRINSSGDSAFWWATTFIIGGCWAVNIVEVLRVLGRSFGGPVQDAIQFTIG